jgi:hypothetical protein
LNFNTPHYPEFVFLIENKQLKIVCYGMEEMGIRNALDRVRSLIAKIFGISAQEARDGSWWETDFILIILLGALLLGISAWL